MKLARPIPGRAAGCATWAGIALVAIVAGCVPITDIRLNATATLDDGSEVFRGRIHGQAYGDGVLTLRGDSGVTCVGTYGHYPDQTGYGDFTCSDGRTGTVTFASTGFRATGTGQVAGAPLSFVVSPSGS